MCHGALSLSIRMRRFGGPKDGGRTLSIGPYPVADVPVFEITPQNGTQAFSPNPAALAGQMVAFKNNDSVMHRVVLNDGSVDTGDIAPGATSRAVLMPASGTNYHCSIHPGMIGAVSGGSGPPPACTGLYCDPY